MSSGSEDDLPPEVKELIAKNKGKKLKKSVKVTTIVYKTDYEVDSPSLTTEVAPVTESASQAPAYSSQANTEDEDNESPTISDPQSVADETPIYGALDDLQSEGTQGTETTSVSYFSAKSRQSGGRSETEEEEVASDGPPRDENRVESSGATRSVLDDEDFGVKRMPLKLKDDDADLRHSSEAEEEEKEEPNQHQVQPEDDNDKGQDALDVTEYLFGAKPLKTPEDRDVSETSQDNPEEGNIPQTLSETKTGEVFPLPESNVQAGVPESRQEAAPESSKTVQKPDEGNEGEGHKSSSSDGSSLEISSPDIDEGRTGPKGGVDADRLPVEVEDKAAGEPSGQKEDTGSLDKVLSQTPLRSAEGVGNERSPIASGSNFSTTSGEPIASAPDVLRLSSSSSPSVNSPPHLPVQSQVEGNRGSTFAEGILVYVPVQLEEEIQEMVITTEDRGSSKSRRINSKKGRKQANRRKRSK